MMLTLKLVVMSVSATWAAIGLLIYPQPAAWLCFLAAALSMRGMWRTPL